MHRPALRWVARLPFEASAAPWPGMQKALTRGWYRFLSFMDRRTNMVFMNYGYAAVGAEEEPPGPPAEFARDRYCAQLYDRVASAACLRGRDVLEVGSGRGGGAAYVARTHAPRMLTGVDFAANAVEFCQGRYAAPNLRFEHGDAEHLPFVDGSFDVVLNVESSHCYPSMGRFLAEAARVLRPGGHLLFADMRHRSAMDGLRADFRASGLESCREREITPNVLRALELDNDRKLGLIGAEVPRAFRPLFRCFAGIKDSPSYEAFRTGEWVYWQFVLRRAA